MPVPALVISPHLDDGVLSCGRFLSTHPGSVVVTIHAGRPHDGQAGEWDVTCGFRTASDAIDTRLAEDRKALRLLDATPEYGFALDSQYPSLERKRRQLQRDAVEGAVREIAAERILIPLGLVHRDHIETREECLAVLRSYGPRDTWWGCYTDLPYGRRWPESVSTARARIRELGIELGASLPVRAAGLERKMASVACYESQVPALFGATEFHYSQLHDERIWPLTAGQS